MPIAGQRVRVPGSGFTVFTWNDGNGDQIIAFAQQIEVAGVTPVAPAQAIQPLNATNPVEIVTPGAHTYGVITLTLTELYNQSVWQRLAGLANSQNVVQIMQTIAANNKGVTISRVINPPAGISTQGSYLESYYNCVITDVADNEQIDITTMVLNKVITVWYTSSFKSWITGGNPGTGV